MIPSLTALTAAIAQAPAASSSGGGIGMTQIVIQFALIIAIIYFLMIRPQQKQRQRHEAALRELKRGDEVVTSGGIVGEVIHIKEVGADKKNTMEDRVTIKSAESRLVVERGRIARIVGTSSAPSQPAS